MSGRRKAAFTEMIAQATEVYEIKHAAASGELHVVCDHAQKTFWFRRCPEHLWDTVINEIKTLTGYVPLDID